MHFAPYIQAELDRLITETGCSAETLVNEVLAAYFDERAKVRQTLDSRYDDLKSGRIQPIDGETLRRRAFARIEEHRGA